MFRYFEYCVYIRSTCVTCTPEVLREMEEETIILLSIVLLSPT